MGPGSGAEGQSEGQAGMVERPPGEPFAPGDMRRYAYGLVWPLELLPRPSTGRLEWTLRAGAVEAKEPHAGLDREGTRRELERRWTGEAYEAPMAGHVSMHVRALATVVPLCGGAGWTDYDATWGVLRGGGVVMPVPGGDLDAWAVHGWRYAGLVARDVLRVVRGLNENMRVGAIHAAVLEGAQGMGRTPAFAMGEWARRGVEWPKDEKGKTLYVWGVRDRSTTAVRVAKAFTKIVYDQTKPVAERSQGEGGYAREAAIFLATAGRALRMVGHVVWEIDRWASKRVVTPKEAIREVKRVVACLDPIAMAPIDRAPLLLHEEAARRRVNLRYVAAGERLFDQIWWRFVHETLSREWGVEPGDGDHPGRCGGYFPPGAKLEIGPLKPQLR